MKLVLHTIDCSHCRALEFKLNKENMEFERETNMDRVIKAGFRSAPVLEVIDEEGHSEFYEYLDAMKWINKNKGTKEN